MLPVATIQLDYVTPQGVLVARWLADAPLAQLQRDYDAVLAAGQAHRATQWLFDVRRRPALSPALLHWLATDWMPRAVAANPQPLRAAYLVARALVPLLRANAGLMASFRTVIDPRRPYHLRTFLTEPAALAWLAQEFGS